MEKQPNTELQIKEAAREVFLQKGFAGARMQDIADKAGINKALLHYYFRSKAKLFEVIFDEAIAHLVPQLRAIFSSNQSVLEKVDTIIDHYIETLKAKPHLPLFIMHELSQNPDRLVGYMQSKGLFPSIQNFISEILQAMDKGEIPRMNPFHLMLNIISMCVFPFVARPIFIAATGMNAQNWFALMESRKTEVKTFVNKVLKP